MTDLLHALAISIVGLIVAAGMGVLFGMPRMTNITPIIGFLRAIEERLEELIELIRPRHRLVFTIGPISTISTEGNMPQFKGKIGASATLILLDNQQCNLAVQVVDGAGNPVTDPGVLTWATSDPTILSLTASVDGLAATIAAVGKLGSAQVSVSLAPTGGGAPLTGSLDVTVNAGPAAGLSIVPGTPTTKP